MDNQKFFLLNKFTANVEIIMRTKAISFFFQTI